jgi:hypothetical protein
MNQLTKIVGGVGILIGMFLVLNNYTASTKIISTIASNSINGIRVLQGR